MIKNGIIKNKKSGFSLIETLVAFFILSLIGIAVMLFQKNIFSFNNLLSENLIAQKDARQTFKMISSEIRSLSPSSIGSYPIAEVNATSFVFYVDIDNDNLKERVHYFLEDKFLKKGVIKPSGDPLSYNPSNEKFTKVVDNIIYSGTPIFEYYDANYDGTGPSLVFPLDILSVRLVKINIFIDKDPSRPPNSLNMTTQVSIRNLKDNL